MQNQKKIEQTIIDIINEHQGSKATLVAALVADRCTKYIHQPQDVIDAIDRLVNEGRIVEVEYVLPSMTYRIKSFLLPASTMVLTSK